MGVKAGGVKSVRGGEKGKVVKDEGNVEDGQR